MTFAFYRHYKAAPVQATALTSVALPNEKDASGKRSSWSSGADGEAAPSSSSANEHMTTRACHSWSYYDLDTDETVLVTLHAHHSLHVDVESGAGVVDRNRSRAGGSSLADAANTQASNVDNQEGLCGYTWELTWLPSPSSPSTIIPSSPARARFFFPRTTPLSASTMHGCGGVLFVSSRYVLIATEAVRASTPSTQPQVLLDGFMVKKLVDRDANINDASAALSYQWNREASTVELPCPAHTLRAAPSSSSFVSVSPLLVSGVHLPRQPTSNSSNTMNATQIRVLYVAAVGVDHSASHNVGSSERCDDDVESLFVGVADIFAASAATADQPAKLQCVPRHAVTETAVQLRLPLRTSDARPHDLVASSSTSTTLSLTPRDLLWVYVADEKCNQQRCAEGTQLFGSLIAVLPCLLGGPSAVGSPPLSSPQLPVVPCTGFRPTSHLGVFTVVSPALDAVAERKGRQQRHRSSLGAAAMDDVLAHLLPPSSAERAVYEVELGYPVEHLRSTLRAKGDPSASSMQLPPHTSVLIFVCDGLQSRGAVGSTQGLYTTQTPSWEDVAGTGDSAVHRLPLARTLWCGLTPVVPPPSAKTSALMGATEGMDMLAWGLTDWKRWTALAAADNGTCSATCSVGSTAAMPLTCGDEESEVGDDAARKSFFPGMASTGGATVATVTAVPSHSMADSTAACCLPRTHAITHELVVWYYVQRDETQNAASPTEALRAAGVVGCLPPLCSNSRGTVDWESQVAEWVVSHYMLFPAPPAEPTQVDAEALTSTYAVLKLLWAYAILHTKPTTAAAADAAAVWPQTLVGVVQSTAADAAQSNTRLHVYARAVQSLVSAELAAAAATAAATMEAELAHMRRAAAVFLRLVLRVLTELDWHAGDPRGRRCCHWMARWFLGEAAFAVSDSSDEKQDCQRQTVLADGRAMQVLMQLGAAESVLAWLRRMVLLYTCRCQQRPLELTMADVVDAAGVPMETTSGQSEGEAEELRWAAEQPCQGPSLHQHSADQVVEWRESMEYALLRMVQPDALYGMMHRLAFVTGCRSVALAAAPHSVQLHGLLSVADLHALVCVGWTTSQIQDTAPLGFTSVCFFVDVAMRATATATAAATPEMYEAVVTASLNAWERGDCEDAPSSSGPPVCVPVYPLLSLFGKLQPQSEVADLSPATENDVSFPFSLFPPLLTIYMWYHLVDHLCRALKLLPALHLTHQADINDGAASAALLQPCESSVDYGDDTESSTWWRRGQRDGAQLQGLHRAMCVLRCLVQDKMQCAEELFAAVQLVFAAHIGDRGEDSGNNDDDVAGQRRDGRACLSWGAHHLGAWEHLVALVVPPPLSNHNAAAAHQKRCQTSSPYFADLMRVLHLVYASAGSAHLLRAHLWRATMGTSARDRSITDDHSRSLIQLEQSLQGWLAAASLSRDAAAPVLSTKTHTPAVDLIASWLVQLWTHVILCDPTAVTDVGIYEQVYAALAHVKQKAGSPPQGPQVDVKSSADVAFAVLRPCLMYAYPMLRQLALAEELTDGSPSGSQASRSPSATGAAISLGYETAPLTFPQFNEPLQWRSAAASRSPRHREWEQLCAGEVCERARRQLGRLAGLYEAPTVAGGSGDSRFRVLGLLLALLPSASDIAQRQRRLARSAEDRRRKENAAGKSARGTPAAQAVLLPSTSHVAQSDSHRSSGSNDSAADETSDEEEEGGVELACLYLSPAAAYVTAASACAERCVPSSSTQLQKQQQKETEAPGHLGWFTVECEVLRRELRTCVVAELLMAGYIARAAHQDEWASEDESRDWQLTVSEKELKAFINALADAVEPLTQALVVGLACPLYQSVILLLVFDILHELFRSDVQEKTSKKADASSSLSSVSAVTIRIEGRLQQLLRQWIRQVVAPLFRTLAEDDQKTVLYAMSTSFAHEYLKGAKGSHVGSNRHDDTQLQQGSKETDELYVSSSLHQTWKRWRHQGGASGSTSLTKTEVAVLGCLEGCVAAEQRHLLHVAPPFQTMISSSSSSNGSHGHGTRAVLAVHGESRKEGSAGGAGGPAASWREAGSALRSSLIHSIGATVAPRGERQHERSISGASLSTAGAPTPQPAPIVEEENASPLVASPSPSVAGVASAAAAHFPAVSSPVSRDVEEAIPLLCKEEAFVRRQLTRQLLQAQQTEFFASPAFQHALVDLYVAMRAEKRRKELVAFALDQHDLIFAFVGREQQVLLEQSRRALRHAWIDYGERQRLALRRLLQEERDARMGVQATAYAGRAFLRETEQAERKVWILQEEGRLGVHLLEQDARDAVTMAAAREQVELARRAVEAEEEAYWKAEDEAWARVGGEELHNEKGGNEKKVKVAPALPPADTGRPAGHDTVEPKTAKPPQRAVQPPSVPTLPPRSPKLTQPVATGADEAAERREETSELETYVHTGLTHAVAHAAAGIGSGANLLGTLSRWQTALRETVAPPPLTRKAESMHEATKAAPSTASREPSIPPPHQHDAPAKTSLVERSTAEERKDNKVDNDGEDDDWGWNSESSSEDATKPTATAACALAPPSTRGSALPNTSATYTQSSASAKPSLPVVVAAPVVPLTSRHIVPLHPDRPPQQSRKAAAVAGGIGAESAPTGAASKPARTKKGFAAAVLVEPITTTASAAAVPEAHHDLHDLPPTPAALPSRPPPADGARHPPCPDDATPNPVRNILSAMEAAATETVLKVRDAMVLAPSSPTSPTQRSTTREEAEEPTPAAAVTSAQLAKSVEGWSEDESNGQRSIVEESAAGPQPTVPTPAMSHAKEDVKDAQQQPIENDVVQTAVTTANALKDEADGWGWSDEEADTDFDSTALKVQPAQTGAEVEPPLKDEVTSSLLPHTLDRLGADTRHNGEVTAAVVVDDEAAVNVNLRPSQETEIAETAASGQERKKSHDDDWGWSEDENEDEERDETSKGLRDVVGVALLPSTHTAGGQAELCENIQLDYVPEETVSADSPQTHAPQPRQTVAQDALAKGKVSDGWGWSDNEENEVGDVKSGALVPTSGKQLADGIPQQAADPLVSERAEPVVRSSDTAPAIAPVADPAGPSPNSLRTAAPLANKPPGLEGAEEAGHDGWSEDGDGSAFGSDIVPAQATSTEPWAVAQPGVLPQQPSGGASNFIDLRVQQLYLTELDVREEMLKFL